MTIMRPIERILAAAALGAALGAATLAIFFAARPAIRISFDADAPRLVSGMFPAERDDRTGLTFAWTGPDMTIRLPGLDRSREWTLEVQSRDARAEPGSHPDLTFYADGLRLSTHRSAAAFETIRVVIPSRPERPRGAVLRMDVSTTVVPGPNDGRALGVMIDEVKISPSGIVWPPMRAAAGSALGAAVLGGAIGASAALPVTAAATLVVSVAQAAMLSRGFGPYTDYPMTAAKAAGWIALAMTLIAGWMYRGGARPVSAARFVVSFSAAALFLKLLVLLHPEMPVGDAMFHAHRFQGVLAGNLYFTSTAPGNYTFPYPPGFYLFTAAFERLVTRGPADMTLLRVVALSVDTFAGAALYVAIRRCWKDAWAAAAAVVVYQMLPLEFRIFTVGNLTNAFAQSVAVLALAMLASARVDRPWGAHAGLLAVVLAVAFMSHTSTFPLLFAACMFIAFLLRWKGDEALARVSVSVLAAAIFACVLAIVLYYAHFGETYRAELSRITSETASAAPDAGGRSLATRAATVPRYLASYLGLGALMLAAAGAWDLYRRGARDRLTLTTAGWALSCIAFLTIGILTPVDMRYYLASVPAIAIAGAAGAAALWSRPRPARIAAGALLAAVCWRGVITWYGTF
jgi:hypothetical protein